jgi:PIN domain nuclease of toxin-antitoxin system
VILLDTHVVVWSLLDAAELGKRARLIVAEAIDARTATVSAIMFGNWAS